jgi:hypothetical protein
VKWEILTQPVWHPSLPATLRRRAQLIGEKEFPTLSHEGEKESIHISVVGRLLLVVVFDERSSLGLVKLRSKQVSQQLAAMFDEIAAADYDELDSPFAGITDEDIDSLFS